MVASFSRNNLRNKKVVDFETFYSQFSAIEGTKIKEWSFCKGSLD